MKYEENMEKYEEQWRNMKKYEGNEENMKKHEKNIKKYEANMKEIWGTMKKYEERILCSINREKEGGDTQILEWPPPPIQDNSRNFSKFF